MSESNISGFMSKPSKRKKPLREKCQGEELAEGHSGISQNWFRILL